MRAAIEERLKRMADYHLSDWARRLGEVGGPGVGGTELAYAPHLVKSAEAKGQLIAMALESSITATWEEAAWCYVYGNYRAAIVLAAALLEIALKYELYRKTGYQKSGTLGSIIQECRKQGIITEMTCPLAESINQRRNDVMHANIQIDRPESLLHHTGNEHETEPLTDLSRNITEDGSFTGDGETIEISFGKGQSQYSRVHIFRRAARASLFGVREVLKSLYASISNQAAHESEDET
jgi:HEPN domain-containing protein